MLVVDEGPVKVLGGPGVETPDPTSVTKRGRSSLVSSLHWGDGGVSRCVTLQTSRTEDVPPPTPNRSSLV